MKEGALKWGLRILGIALAVGPILTVMAMHNFDIQAAFLPSDEEMASVQNNLTGLFDMDDASDMFSMGTPSINGNNISIPIVIESPFQMPITIKSMSASMTDGGSTIAQVSMVESDVAVASGGSANINLAGQFTGGIPVNPTPSSVAASIEVLGVTIEMDTSSFMGGF